MKLIDLLNKIAKGEEVPKKIKFYDEIYEIEDAYDDNIKQMYYTKEKNCSVALGGNLDFNVLYHINDEVEIIEEDKKIEKIERVTNDQYIGWSDNERVLVKDIIELQNKVDELIDEVNKLKGDK